MGITKMRTNSGELPIVKERALGKGAPHREREHWAREIAKTLWDERICHLCHTKKVENEKRCQFKIICNNPKIPKSFS
jgi:hypothetical protein